MRCERAVYGCIYSRSANQCRALGYKRPYCLRPELAAGLLSQVGVIQDRAFQKCLDDDLMGVVMNQYVGGKLNQPLPNATSAFRTKCAENSLGSTLEEKNVAHDGRVRSAWLRDFSSGSSGSSSS